MLESCHVLVLWSLRSCLICLNPCVLIPSLISPKVFIGHLPCANRYCICWVQRSEKKPQKFPVELPFHQVEADTKKRVKKNYNMKMTISVTKKNKTRKGVGKFQGRLQFEVGWSGKPSTRRFEV